MAGWGIVAIGSTQESSAQISPGPLARAHQALDTAGQCFRCHERGDDQALNRQCRSCHRAIDEQIDRRAGLHGRERLVDCAGCHPDHAGRDFELIEWSAGGRDSFDHARTGWSLDGSHATVACLKCHRAEYRASGLDDGPEGTSPTFLGLSRDCVNCHVDPHLGALARDCSTCHGLDAWKPASTFDHDDSGFPLTGRHQQVACSACHTSPQFRAVAHQECAPCHKDAHAGRLGTKCSSCHTTASFSAIRTERFDHALTRYPLVGRHAVVPCSSCHAESTGGKRPPFATCGSCHRDAHAGQARVRGEPADCAACHDPRGFSPSTFSVDEHRRSVYPLEGRHREVACAKCHRKAPTNTAPPTDLGPAGVRLRPNSGRCADCHADAHGGQLAQRRDGGACEACHSVLGFSPSTFSVESHSALAFALDGAHAAAPCSACHGPSRQDIPPLSAEAARGSARVALSTLDPACAACHYDPHGERLARADDVSTGDPCLRCHSTVAFKPSTVADAAHARFQFALSGAHLATPCFDCHKELTLPRGAIRLRRADPPQAALPFAVERFGCVDCHPSPHGDQFVEAGRPEACERCHDQVAFIPATRFDHDRVTAFRLTGAHDNVPCAGCHPQQSGPDGIGRPRYRPTPGACSACHASADAREEERR